MNEEEGLAPTLVGELHRHASEADRRHQGSGISAPAHTGCQMGVAVADAFFTAVEGHLFFDISARARFSISCGGTSSLCVAMLQMLPEGSITDAERSP